MKLQLLGTGSPRPSLTRKGSSYLLHIGDDVLVFDHGPGSHDRLLEAGYSAGDVTHLFFSHFHYDHCLDYPRLLMTRWDHYGHAVEPLNVYGPPHTAAMTEALFGERGAYWPDIAVRTGHDSSKELYVARGGTLPRPTPSPVVDEWKGGEVLEGNGWTVRAVTVPHVQPFLHSLGYRVDTETESFAYSGDSGPSEDFIELARDCDVLVHMCYQISGSALNQAWSSAATGHLEVAEIAARANVKNLVLSHISPDQMDIPGIRERLIAEVAAKFSGNIFWAEDLMEIPFDAPVAGTPGKTI